MEMEMKVRIKQLYQRLEMGYNSMPLDLPGTSFHKAMKVITINKHIFNVHVIILVLVTPPLSLSLSHHIYIYMYDKISL